MKIAVFAHHVGSQGLKPSGQYGGGELLTFGWLSALQKHYNVMTVVPNGVYPAFDSACEYGIDLSGIDWRPVGDTADWIRKYDCLINISHSSYMPPICQRNIMVTMFPQQPDWDTSGYDTVCAISQFSADWIKRYWGREAKVVYPLLPVQDTIDRIEQANYDKQNNIVAIGRFFNVPWGNNKSHSTLISAFQGMYKGDWTLTFVGSVQNPKYLQEVKQAANGDQRIRFFHDLKREQYLELLGKSRFLWHAAGYEATKPSSMEHFGIIAVEAQAAGVQPFVFNGGGIVEIPGVIPWDTPAQLSEYTVGEMEKPTPNPMQENALTFDIERNTERLLEIIEDPQVVVVPKPEQAKIYVGDPSPSDIKVGVISDDPNITTGFGAVSRAVVKGLIRRGFRVAAMGIQNPIIGKTKLVPEDIRRIFGEVVNNPQLPTAKMMTQVFEEKLSEIELCTTWRGCSHDPSGFDMIEQFLKVEKPDVLYVNYDPGNIRNILSGIQDAHVDIPIVAYVPIEGSPVIPQYIEMLRTIKVMNGEPIVYTYAGQKAVMEAGGPKCRVAWHGADHAPFRMLDPETRKQLKIACGWGNKKVMMFVGRNKRTKGFGTLLKTARILKDMGRDDIVWYLHTWVWDQMPNSSMPLDQWAKQYGVADRIVFPEIQHQVYGIPYDEPATHPHIDENELAQMSEQDATRKLGRIAFNSLSLVERYGIATAFINASEVEGHGLTYLEAMGCGVPVISVDDQGVQQEVIGNAALYVPVKHWDDFHTGARLAQGDPQDFARAIIDLVDNQDLYNEMQQKALERHQQFKWDKTVDIIAKAIIERYIV